MIMNQPSESSQCKMCRAQLNIEKCWSDSFLLPLWFYCFENCRNIELHLFRIRWFGCLSRGLVRIQRICNRVHLLDRIAHNAVGSPVKLSMPFKADHINVLAGRLQFESIFSWQELRNEFHCVGQALLIINEIAPNNLPTVAGTYDSHWNGHTVFRRCHSSYCSNNLNEEMKKTTRKQEGLNARKNWSEMSHRVNK